MPKKKYQKRPKPDIGALLHEAAAKLARLFQAGAPEDVAKLVAFLRGFHQYSFLNTVLIWVQDPEATLVASYATWKKKGRWVKKGEKARIWVRVPYFKKVVKKELDENGREVEVEEKELVGFGWGAVFDVRQTDGEPVPELEQLSVTVDEPKVALDRLVHAAEALGVTRVVFRPFRKRERGLGYWHRVSHEIHINTRADINKQVTVLIHEIGHHLLHQSPAFMMQETHLKELEAEATAALVGHALGIQGVFPSAWQYIAMHYQADDKAAAKDFEARMRRIMNAAQKIVRAYDEAPIPVSLPAPIPVLT